MHLSDCPSLGLTLPCAPFWRSRKLDPEPCNDSQKTKSRRVASQRFDGLLLPHISSLASMTQICKSHPNLVLTSYFLLSIFLLDVTDSSKLILVLDLAELQVQTSAGDVLCLAGEMGKGCEICLSHMKYKSRLENPCHGWVLNPKLGIYIFGDSGTSTEGYGKNVRVSPQGEILWTALFRERLSYCIYNTQQLCLPFTRHAQD